ncbi:TVG0678392 [Thermoplasma volcanium GSS1]|uniref:TVG0678392 protein n=1 Tax=Thermoplasma volcanium (strain ATCC 51530 / DSM 4299 / JCM 9571 / NBRC 15438 / GSS1) TaxID=273116 RepID=Q97AY1_THEVO|nr:hypothetical protein [Thermoplasma volcanium]BAB59820.1 TVG0678392 [Thermoplasma volcanium GSS1]
MRSDKVDKTKKYPPAYYRYREKHVTLSILLSNDFKEFLDHYKKSGMTYPEIVKDALEKGKRMSEILQAEANDKLALEMDAFVKASDLAYKERLEKELATMEETIRARVKESVLSAIAISTERIQKAILNSFAFDEHGKQLIRRIFERYRFTWNSVEAKPQQHGAISGAHTAPPQDEDEDDIEDVDDDDQYTPGWLQ